MIAVLFLMMTQSRKTSHNKNPTFPDITQKFNTEKAVFAPSQAAQKKRQTLKKASDA